MAAKRARKETPASAEPAPATAPVSAPSRPFPKVKAVRAYVAHADTSKGDQGADCHDVDDQHWINGFPTPIANPMSGWLAPRLFCIVVFFVIFKL